MALSEENLVSSLESNFNNFLLWPHYQTILPSLFYRFTLVNYLDMLPSNTSTPSNCNIVDKKQSYPTHIQIQLKLKPPICVPSSNQSHFLFCPSLYIEQINIILYLTLTPVTPHITPCKSVVVQFFSVHTDESICGFKIVRLLLPSERIFFI